MRDQHGWMGLGCTGALLVGVLFGGPALALTWRTGDTVQVASGEVVHDDLYIGGQDVRVDGTVTGDLIATGGTVTVNGAVRGNVWAAGSTVILNGPVAQSARIAGSVLRVGDGAKVGRDLLAAGQALGVDRGARIGRDLAFGGAQARLDGGVARNAYVGAYAVQVGGPIGGDGRFSIDNRASWTSAWTPSAVRPDPLASGLHFTGGGRVNGDLSVQMPDRPTLPAGAVGGRVDYTPLAATPRTERPVVNPAVRLAADFARAFVGIALAGLLLVWLARRPLERVRAALWADPAASLGYGTLAFVGFPLLVLLGLGVAVTLAALLGMMGLGNLGLPLAFIGAPAVLGLGLLVGWLALLGAQGLAALVLGDLLLHLGRPQAPVSPVGAVLVGALGLALLLQVPVLGGLVTLTALLFALGALWRMWRGGPPAERRSQVKTQPA